MGLIFDNRISMAWSYAGYIILAGGKKSATLTFNWGLPPILQVKLGEGWFIFFNVHIY